MGTSPVERGPTARTVSANVQRLRLRRNLSLRELAERVADAGRPLTHTAITKLENGDRRVDVDDLVALAVALEVSPVTLLMPDVKAATERVEATGVTAISASHYWDWLTTQKPLRGMAMQFWADALPSWLVDMLADQMGPQLAALMERNIDRGND